jgi:3-methylfumaryl-CoA hydratase
MMIADAFDTALLQQWVGNTETVPGHIGAEAASALAATLDRPTAFAPGAPLPPLWHWIYFWTAAPQAELGPDGHAQRGGFLPPVPLPRRMWAGGRLSFPAPLPVEADATRSSRVLSVNTKRGASGNLAFVTVAHEIAHEGVVCVTEEHDIVYRAMPQPGEALPAPKIAPSGEAWSRTVTPDPVRRHLPDARLSAFSFRAVGPLFDIEPFTLCGLPDPDGRGVQLWAKNTRGELAMQAQATLAAPI